MDVLSMGMSHDFEVAIEEGSTCVRVGRRFSGKEQRLNHRGHRGTEIIRGNVQESCLCDSVVTSSMIPIHDRAGVTFAVKVHPRAKKNAITGEVGDALKLSLTAPPVEGRANEACIEFFAKLLKVPRSSVTIASGQTSRNKVIRVAGMTGEYVRDRLTAERGRRRSAPHKASGATLTFSERFDEIRTGFERPFWVANITEIFERLSYYGAFASLALYLQEKLNFSTEQTGTLTGIFGGMVWFLAIFGGAAADRLGFRRALSVAYLILGAAYFLIGSIGASWLAPVRNAVPLGLFVGFILILPALGSFAGEALRGGHHGARLQGERPLDRLLDLLHDGQHRRRRRALFRFLGASPPGRRERLSRRRAQRLRDVFCGPALLPRAAQGRRRASALHRDRRAEFLRRAGQLPAGLARVAGRLVAAHRAVDLSGVACPVVDLGWASSCSCSRASAGSCGSW